MSSSEAIVTEPVTPQEREAVKLFETLQSKASLPGYKKEMVRRFAFQIEDALAKGYNYEEIAGLFKQVDIEIAPSTLKKYHLEVRKHLDASSKSEPIVEGLTNGKLNEMSSSQEKSLQNSSELTASNNASLSEDNPFDAAVNILANKKR